MTSLFARIVCALVALAAAPTSFAQQGGINVPEHVARPVVMELFSSQGCGNCPAANANVEKLAERTDVIALTYPVGIWDYLGWDDTFARPEFLERQKRYNRTIGYRGPYTPQVIYSGEKHGPGTDMTKLAKGFAARDITPYPVGVAFDGEKVVVAGNLPDKVVKASVVLVRFRAGQTKVTPAGGPNKGKAMTYWNLVTGYETIGEWKGGMQNYQAACNSGCAVLVQKDGAEGAILGAAQK